MLAAPANATTLKTPSMIKNEQMDAQNQDEKQNRPTPSSQVCDVCRRELEQTDVQKNSDLLTN